MPKINGEVVRSIPIPLPSAGEAERAALILGEADVSVDELERDVVIGLGDATRLRQSILAAAFSGKLLSEAEQTKDQEAA